MAFESILTRTPAESLLETIKIGVTVFRKKSLTYSCTLSSQRAVLLCQHHYTSLTRTTRKNAH